MSTLVTPDEFRQAMGRFATGVTVITAQHEGESLGMTANAVTSVSLEPPLVLICVDHRRAILRPIEASGRFTINVLAEAQEGISRYYARQSGAPEAVSLETRPDWPPLVPGALATLDCTVHETHHAGDHAIIIGRVDQAATSTGDPLLYFEGRYAGLPRTRTEA